MIEFRHRGLIQSLRWGSVECRYLVINPDLGGLQLVLCSAAGGMVTTNKGESVRDVHRLSLSMIGIRQLFSKEDFRPPLNGLSARIDATGSGFEFQLQGFGVLCVVADEISGTWD